MPNPETASIAVTVRGLVKRYGDRPVVNGLDLTIHTGEVFALLGPNGAGKTTTVEILEGYRKRDGGEVSVLGVDPQHADNQWRSRIGIVAQTATDAAELTVDEIIRNFAGYYPNPRDPDEVVELVGLVEKRSTRIRKLSGGQRRRVDVALGIIGSPELLFLDEPTTGFDPAARRQFWELIRALRQEGTTIILTTHYLDEVEQLADRVAVIADGQLLDLNTPQLIGGTENRYPQVRYTDRNGVHQSVSTGEPSRVLRQLLNEYDGEVPNLEVVRPTLEDVYLTMIAGAGSAASAVGSTARSAGPTAGSVELR